jgi:hypothetical protein
MSLERERERERKDLHSTTAAATEATIALSILLPGTRFEMMPVGGRIHDSLFSVRDCAKLYYVCYCSLPRLSSAMVSEASLIYVYLQKTRLHRLGTLAP